MYIVKESRDCGKFGEGTPRLLPLTNGAHQSELPAERPPQHATIPSMAEFRFRLNPRAGELPHCSAVLNGRGTRYEVNDYRTTLSLKSVVRGAARYHTPQGHYLLAPDSFLILNDGQRYSLEFEGGGRVQTETVCPFFQRGFLEQAAAGDLDDIDRAAPALDFCERLYPKTGSVARALADLHAGLRGPHPSTPWLEDRMYALAQSLAGLRLQVRDEAQSFPGLRPSTPWLE